VGYPPRHRWRFSIIVIRYAFLRLLSYNHTGTVFKFLCAASQNRQIALSQQSAWLEEISGQSPRLSVYNSFMKKMSALCMTIFVLCIVTFGTWQLYQGHFEAAFSSFPFLLIMYLFVKSLREKV
jgi:uncharacterized membrane protein